MDVPSGGRFHPRCPKLVRPADYEFKQESWRAVAGFRRDLREGDLSFIAEDKVPTPETIRESYEIPPQLSFPHSLTPSTPTVAYTSNTSCHTK